MRKTSRPAPPLRSLEDKQLERDHLRFVAGGDIYMHNPRGSNNRLDGQP